MSIYNRTSEESILEYKIRLFKNKKEYKLTNDQISGLISAETGETHFKNYYRNWWYAFQEGCNYTENRIDFSVYNRILVLSDFHVPFQLPVSTFSKYFNKVDTLVINGDVTDCAALSKFSKLYRSSPMDEIIESRNYLIDLIKSINPKKVIIIYGNHDIRLQNYLARNLDTDILELMPKSSLELIAVDGFNHYNKDTHTKSYYEPLTRVFPEIVIEYPDTWWTQIGDSVFCHPLAFSQGILKTTEKAMSYFQNIGISFKTICLAHTHRQGFYRKGDIRLYEQGCCCDVTKLQYNDGKLVDPAKEGFLYMGQDENGNTLYNTVVLEELK